MSAPVGNQNAVSHGVEGSIKRLADGRALVGRAYVAQAQVRSEMETDGAVVLLRRNVERTQAVTDLIWNEIQAAVEHDDSDEFDRWVRRFGWLIGVVNRAIQQLSDFEKAGDEGTSARDVLDALRAGEDGGTHETDRSD